MAGLLQQYSGATWTDYYPSGYINLKNDKPPEFTPTILARDATADAITNLLKTGTNLVENFSEQKTSYPLILLLLILLIIFCRKKSYPYI